MACPLNNAPDKPKYIYEIRVYDDPGGFERMEVSTVPIERFGSPAEMSRCDIPATDHTRRETSSWMWEQLLKKRLAWMVKQIPD